MKALPLLFFLGIHTLSLSAQKIELSLNQTINTARDSSLKAFSAKNSYLSSYWAYRSYQAARLPSLTLEMTPLTYDRSFTSRYDSETNRDVYRQQQSLYSYGNLAIEQNFDLTGGTFYIDSELGYVKNFGTSNYQEFSSVPLRIGYSQDLLGYNSFKWEKRIQPIKYEKAKKKLLYSIEEIAETAAEYFFALAMAQVEFDLAKTNLASSDTLYQMGIERQEIASISQADLLTLKLDVVNARNTFQNAEISLKKAMFSYVTYLNMDKKTTVRLILPQRPENMDISAEKALEYVRQNNPGFLTNRQSLLEAEQVVEKTTKSSKMEASLDLSIGFNQVASKLKDSYKSPLEQDVVAVSLEIPLVDWGVRKGKVNMAKNDLNVTKLTVQQDELSLEEEILMTVNDFNIQQNLISSAEEAVSLADMAYDATKQRFLIGKADISSLTLSLNRQESARKNYISALQNYWLSYFKIRKLTLYDFDKKESLSLSFDKRYGIL
jgi:outer membrane protein TolC